MKQSNSKINKWDTTVQDENTIQHSSLFFWCNAKMALYAKFYNK
jgi:hypothetical protein